jgi:predicted N-acetyltransferase YhbS
MTGIKALNKAGTPIEEVSLVSWNDETQVVVTVAFKETCRRLHGL